MAANQVFRVYDDEEAMLKVYSRRLLMADRKFDQRKPMLEKFVGRYQNQLSEDQLTSRGHRVSVTTGIGLIDTMYSSMTAVDVEFILRNVGHGTREQGVAAERGLNQAWRDTKGQERVKRAVKDALIVDTGWVKVYYDYVEDVDLRDKPEEAVRAELAAYMADNPKVDAEDAILHVDLTEEIPMVLRDRVCVDYVPFGHVRVDPSAKQIEDVRWVAQYTEMPVPEVAHNPTYRAFVYDRYGKKKGGELLDDLEGDTTISADEDYSDVEGLGSDEFDDDTRVTVVEMWDLETGLVTVYPKGRFDLVLHQRANPLMFNLDLEDRNPFKPLQVRDDPDAFEGLGDMRIIWPALKELDEYRSNAATYVARSIPKYFGPERALSENGKKAIESREWGAYVGLAEGHDFREIGSPPPPPFPEKIYAIADKIEAEMKEATGANEVLRGVFPSRRTTATEAQLVTDAGERRQAERRSKLEAWYIAIARTMLQLIQLYYDQERILRYTDNLGQEFAWSWTKEDIALDADLDIAITPKENSTRSERFQKASVVANLALPLPETDRSSVLRWVFQELGMRDDEIRLLVKTPEEVQAEQGAQQAQQAALPVSPQMRGNAPQGLSIG